MSEEVTLIIGNEQPMELRIGDSESPINLIMDYPDFDPNAGGAGSDVNFVQPFTNLDVVPVTHNLGKKPSVTVVDTAGDEVEGHVNHVSNDELVVSFSASFSGIIILN